MTTDRKSYLNLPAGIAAAGLVAGIAGHALAQQRPMSINEWLQAESGNVNMQRAIQEYERAQHGTATQPPAYQAQQYRQPQYQQPQYQQPQYQAPQYQAPQYQAPQQTYQQQPYYPQQQAQTPQTAPQGAPHAAPQQPVQQQPIQQQPQPLTPGQTQPQGQLPKQPNQQNTYQVPPDALEKIDREAQKVTPAAFSNRGYYLGGHFGWTIGSATTFDDAASSFEPEASLFAFQMEGAAGYKFNSGLSMELAGSYNYTEFDDSEGYASVFAIMPNAKMEFDIGHPVLPYVTGGVGVGVVNAEDI